jgi:P-type Cu+ transporter
MTRLKRILKSILIGIAGTSALLSAYFLILTAVSNWQFTLDQFFSFWYFIVALALGFGVQIGLFTYLRSAIHAHCSGKLIAVSGATSTVAMVSCCAHYLVNILPIISVTGLVAFVGQYQVELFWFGLACNLAGILYMGNRVFKFSRAHVSA